MGKLCGIYSDKVANHDAVKMKEATAEVRANNDAESRRVLNRRKQDAGLAYEGISEKTKILFPLYR
jgi:hypothetical protein